MGLRPFWLQISPESRRYVALNPVRAHLAGRDDGLVRVQPLIDRAPRFPDLLDTDAGNPGFVALRRNELIGRPLGDDAFLDAISRRLNRVVTPRKRGTRAMSPAPRRKGKDGRVTVIACGRAPKGFYSKILSAALVVLAVSQRKTEPRRQRSLARL